MKKFLFFKRLGFLIIVFAVSAFMIPVLLVYLPITATLMLGEHPFLVNVLPGIALAVLYSFVAFFIVFLAKRLNK